MLSPAIRTNRQNARSSESKKLGKEKIELKDRLDHLGSNGIKYNKAMR